MARTRARGRETPFHPHRERDRCCTLRAAVLQVGGDAGGPEGVIADPGPDPCRLRPALDHRVSIRLREGRAGQPPFAPADRAKQRPPADHSSGPCRRDRRAGRR